MTIKAGRRIVAFSTGVLACGILFLGFDQVPANAFVPPPGLAEALVTVFTDVFKAINKKPKPDPQQQAQVDKAKKALIEYAKREQIVWKIVTASGVATKNVAAMRQITQFETKLDKNQITDLNDNWNLAEAGITAIIQSKPQTSVFDTNSSQLVAINELLQDGPGLVKNITAELKYDPDKPNDRLFKHLQANVASLDGILQRLNNATGSEIEILADELSVLATQPSSAASDPKKVKNAGKDVANSAFGDVQKLDKPISESQEQLSQAFKAEIKIQAE